jgi:hypothetical protein
MREAGLHLALMLVGAGVVALGLVMAAGERAGAVPGAIAGSLLAGAGGACGFAATVAASKKDQKAFMRAVFGGMLLRLSGYGLALVAVHLFTSWSVGWFAAGLLGAHLLGQLVEIDYLARKARRRRTEPPEGGGGDTEP